MLIKAFRLFVSSTFADFAAEREALQKDVFPALDAYCTAKGYQCYPIDLRWGVNEEAQLDQRTAKICVGEVRAAKQDYPPPNFLIMIGNRYGLVPLPYAIAQDEFDAILAWLNPAGDQMRRAHSTAFIGTTTIIWRRVACPLLRYMMLWSVPTRCAHGWTNCRSFGGRRNGRGARRTCVPYYKKPPTVC